MTYQYEMALLDKLYREKDNQKRRDAILEKILTNCHFYCIYEIRQGDPSLPIEALSQIVKEYLELEEN